MRSAEQDNSGSTIFSETPMRFRPWLQPQVAAGSATQEKYAKGKNKMNEAVEEPKSALIIGASRGLGLGLSRELLKRGWRVTATVRSATGGTGLEAYHERVTMDTLDINNLSSVAAFVHRMEGKMFDVVLVNAGTGGPEGKTPETVSS